MGCLTISTCPLKVKVIGRARPISIPKGSYYEKHCIKKTIIMSVKGCNIVNGHPADLNTAGHFTVAYTADR